MKNLHLISMKTDNMLGLIQRVSTLFSRNRISVRTMNISEGNAKNSFQFNIEVFIENDLVERLKNKMSNIVEAHDLQVRAETVC